MPLRPPGLPAPAARLQGLRSTALCLALLLTPLAASAATTNVRITTALGTIDIQLYDTLRPVSVSNFLNYVNDGDYDGSFIHRSKPGFVIQGGGFRFVNGSLEAVPTDPGFQDTPGPSNVRGTIAMAENGSGIATSQWFITLVDNTGRDANFTVFGEVTAGLDVVDQLALVPVYDGSLIHSAFTDLPLMNYVFPNPVLESNFVTVTLPEPGGLAASWLALATMAALRRLRRA